TTEVNTVFPPNSTKIFAPHGSTGWSTPSVFGPSRVPHPETRPASGRERTPARAGYQPLTLDTAGFGSAARATATESFRDATASPTTPARSPAASTAS